MESEQKENPENSGVLLGGRDELGRFKDGISGNPNGKPRGVKNFTTKVREALESVAEGKDYTYEAAFIKAILKKSIVDQDVSMMRTVWEQLDGKPLQRMANADGTNITAVPIYGGVSTQNQGHDGNTKDIPTEEEN